jgi:hypothetical protein
VDRNASNLSINQLAFACMNTDADLKTETTHRLADREAAPDCTCGAIERCENAISGSTNFGPAKSREFGANRSVIGLDDILPSPVAHFGRQIGRAYDVSEKHSGENSVWLTLVAHPGQKLLDFGHEAITVLRKKEVINASKLDIPGCGNVFGEIPAVLRSGKGIACLMQY